MNDSRRALVLMHEAHGVAAGKTCGECVSIVLMRTRPHPTSTGSTAEWGCRAFNATHKSRPRWAKSWLACGKVGKA